MHLLIFKRWRSASD